MDEIRQILEVAVPYWGVPPGGMQDEHGFFYAAGEEIGWAPYNFGSTAGTDQVRADTERLVQEGLIRPIFHGDNVGGLRAWPQAFIPQLAGFGDAPIQIAARILEACVAKWPPGSPLKIPSYEEIMEAAAELNFEGAPRDVLAVAEDLYAPAVTDPGFAILGSYDTLEGADIDLSWDSSDGEPVTDYQDVFAALKDIADYMRIPETPDGPSVYLNRTSKNHMAREDPDLMEGAIGDLYFKVGATMEVTRTALDAARQASPPDISEELAAIHDALVRGVVIPPPDPKKNETVSPYFRRTTKTTFIFQTSLTIDYHSIYLAGIIKPKLMRTFFANELGNIYVQRTNHVFYYSTETEAGGPLTQSHIYLEKLEPMEATKNWSPLTTRPHVYSISLTHSHPTHAERFRRDLESLVQTIAAQHDKIAALRPLVDTEPPKPGREIHPPVMSTTTRAHTTKTANSKARLANAANRPIYIPLDYAGNPNYAFAVAKTLSRMFHAPPTSVYIALADTSFVTANEPSLHRPGIHPVSSYYVSARPDQRTVTNMLQDGSSIMPWCPTPGRADLKWIYNVEFKTPFRGYTWYVESLYGKPEPCTLLNALAAALAQQPGATPDLSRGLEALARAHPSELGGPRGAASLCRPELFDHTTEEVLQTLGRPRSDIHIRLLEHLTDTNIYILTPTTDTPGKSLAPKDTELTMELPRRAGNPLRDLTRPRAVALLRYQMNGNSMYAPLKYYRSEPPAPDFPKTCLAPGQPMTLLNEELHQAFSHHYLTRTSSFLTHEMKPSPPNYPLDHTRLAPHVQVLYQTLNPDGYATSLTVSTNYHSLHAGLASLARSMEIPYTEPAGPNVPLVVTVNFVRPTEPLPIPENDIYRPAPANLDFPAEETIRAPGATVHRLGNLFLSSAPAQRQPGRGAFAYQRPVVVLLSLVKWTLLNFRDDPIEDIERALQETARSLSRPGSAEVLVAHRYPPLIGNLPSFRHALAALTSLYLAPGIPLGPAGIARLLNYAKAELATIRACRIPASAQKHIDGILDFLPQAPFCPSPRTLTKFPPAQRGLASITTGWKSYEYARSRYEARESMGSWSPLVDLTDAETAKEMTNWSAFTMRTQGGAVIQASATNSVEDARTVNAAIAARTRAENIAEPIIGFASLKKLDFKALTVAIYNTSTAKAQNNPNNKTSQGSLYRIIAYPPK